MESFSFLLPTRIAFGNGMIHRVGEEATALGGTRAFIVTDPGIVAAGLTEPVIGALGKAGLESIVFSALEANPRDTSVARGAEVAGGKNCDLLVGVGGGSAIDTAKAIGVIRSNGGSITDYEGLDVVKKPIPPLIAIPTTAGTGTEVTFWSVITDTKRSFKMSIGSSLLAPTVALVDPEVTVGLPPDLTASTGMDALTHAIEAYTATVSQPVTDSLALSAIELIGKSLGKAYANGANRQARYDMMLASLLAGLAFGNSDIGGVHCMAEAIGGLYDTPHGVANAIYLPVVMEHNCMANPEKFARIARALGVNTANMSTNQAARCSHEVIRELSESLDIPSAKEVGVLPEDFKKLAKAAAINVSVESNPRVIDVAGFYQLFEKAYEE
jgi:alcohol dehydrogenase